MASTSEYWYDLGKSSVLLSAVSRWRSDPELWFSKSFDRLPETVRVNPLRSDMIWVESWLEKIGAKRIIWFNDLGGAWTLPFERGKAEGEVKFILTSLHDTGRITRQEAVSMIPVIALDVKPGQKVLDMCASPGSKTTQISENLDNRGVVVANEIANSRINTLVSNVQRHGSRTPMIVHHDGRHIPKIPGKGYDRVLVDAPCTGSGTTRKNPEVWKKWLPSGSRALHRLQLELLGKAIDVSRPGGRIVYSTCSLDPIENEAVIAEILRKYPVNVISASEILDLVPHEEGFQDWPILDDRGVIDDSLTVSNSMLPPKEVEIIDAMKKCVRIWNDKIDGGGFFVTILEKSKINIGEEGAIKTVIDNHVKPDAETFPKPIDRKMKKKIINSLGKCPDNLWIRGKKILWSTKEAMFIWEQEKSRKSGRIIIPGKRWRPLKVIDIGLSTIKLRNGEIDRIVGRAATQIIPEIQEGYMEVSGEIIDRLLIGDQIFPREIEIELDSFRGGLILIDDRNDACIPVWIGKKVSLMINESEQIILRAIRGLEITINEEE